MNLKVTFQVLGTNNVVEYKALITELKMTTKAGLQWLVIHNDSQLFVRQVIGQLECKDPTLSQYRKLVQSLQKQFKTLQISKLPRDQNARANKLSKRRL